MVFITKYKKGDYCTFVSFLLYLPPLYSKQIDKIGRILFIHYELYHYATILHDYYSLFYVFLTC